MSAGTLTGLFFDAVERYASHPAAFRYKAEGGTWQSVSHREVEERVRAISVGLRELGISPGDRVAILSETRLEWTLDRKSTRLNSSHGYISYAVFCLKKKKKKTKMSHDPVTR